MAILAGSSDGDVSLEARDLLRRYRRVAMVGLSANPARPSYRVAAHLVAYGYEVLPVNPNVEEVLGRRAVPDLDAAAALGPLEIVDVFRRPEEIPAVAADAARLGAAVLWLQLGLRHPEAAATARAAGVEVVEDRCLKMEHCRWFGGLNWVGLTTGVVSSRREEHHRAG